MATREIEIAWWVRDAIDDLDSNGFFVHAGLGAGKTHGIWQWLYDRQKLNKRCVNPIYWFVMPTHGKVQDTAVPKWYTLAESLGLREGQHFRLYETKPMRLILFDEDREITTYFHSADRPNLMVGTEIAGAVGDECAEYKFEVFERTVTRLRDKNAEVLQFFFGGAPQGMNWFADWANFDYYDAEKKFKSYELWTDDNAHNLPPGYIENQLLTVIGSNPNKIKSWRYGQFTNFFEGSAYPDFTDADIEHVEPHPSTPLILTWDNNAPLAWVAGQVRTIGESRTKKLCWSRESKDGLRLITDATVNFISQFEPGDGWRDTPIILDGDAALYSPSVRQAGSSFDEIISILRKYYTNISLVASRHNPLQEVRVEAVNKAFSYGRCLVSPECPQTIKSFRRVAWKEGHDRELAKPKAEDVNRYSDAAGYHMTRWIGNELLGPHKKRTMII